MLTDNEIVQMFKLPSPKDDETQNLPVYRSVSRRDPSVQILDERFIRILKIFKWGPDAEKALEVLKLKVDHRLVHEVELLGVGGWLIPGVNLSEWEEMTYSRRTLKEQY